MKCLVKNGQYFYQTLRWHHGTVAPWHRGTVAPWHRGHGRDGGRVDGCTYLVCYADGYRRDGGSDGCFRRILKLIVTHDIVDRRGRAQFRAINVGDQFVVVCCVSIRFRLRLRDVLCSVARIWCRQGACQIMHK